MSSHCARACEKARRQELIAKRVVVFARSNAFREDLKQYSNSMEYRLVNPTSDSRIITKVAKLALRKIFRAGIYYKKVGVMLEELIPNNSRQPDIFLPLTDESLLESDQLMKVLDKINSKYGSQTIRLAAEGYSSVWKMRAQMRSPCYTTRWSELPRVT